MPRLIILLLILAALAILVVQNLSTPISLVILGSARTPEIPFGLLLLGAVCIGALITLILYGLVGLRRPPESKYRPIGRRVPYPDTPGSPMPASSSPYSPTDAAAPSASSYDTASSSTAFVSEPAAPPPQDSFRPDPASAVPSNSYPYQSGYRDPLTSTEPPFNVEQPSFIPEQIEEPTEKKKSRFSRQADPLESLRIGEDWGEVSSTRQRDRWDTEAEFDREPGIAGVKRSLFDFIGINNPAGGSSGSANVGDRDIDDLDSGWENLEGYDSSSPSSEGLDDASGRRLYRDGLYSNDDGPHSRHEGEGYEEVYEDAGYEDDSVYEADYRVIVPPSQPLDQPLDKSEEENHS